MTAYISTRGRAPRLGFRDATLAGLADDGGLYVPESFPALSVADVKALAQESYVASALRVMLPFVGADIPRADLAALLERAYGAFDDPGIAPLRDMGGGIFLMELFHGPTLAFKDVALQFLGQAFDHILREKRQKVTIIGATSGDTGSAAIEAFRGRETADIFILHPRGRVSEVQRRQMTTVRDDNVFNIAVEGSFDDCQALVKDLFADAPFREEMRLSAVNSINWARILAQAVYYARAAAQVEAQMGARPAFCVPTGNFGNIYAGYVAKQMGAPVGKLVAATNANDILHRFFTTGRMKAEGVSPTISPSMDIQVSSNFERLLFDIFERQGAVVDQTMRHFRTGGSFHIDEKVMETIREAFGSGRRDDAQTLDIIRRVHAQSGVTLDPHTAVGFGVAGDIQREQPGGVVVTLATAHPAKFPDAVEQATRARPALPARLQRIMTEEEKLAVLPPGIEAVRDFIRQNAKRG